MDRKQWRQLQVRKVKPVVGDCQNVPTRNDVILRRSSQLAYTPGYRFWRAADNVRLSAYARLLAPTEAWCRQYHFATGGLRRFRGTLLAGVKGAR